VADCVSGMLESTLLRQNSSNSPATTAQPDEFIC
jgi:hypothetical protein